MRKSSALLLSIILSAFVSSYSQNMVSIGLLVQDKAELAAIHGAQLAVNEANKQNQSKGWQFRLVTKSMEGPWGTGSKQAVSLIWEDGVCALVGSHDGRNAHLVEQASAKTIIPFISAWSSDPTLSHAFIPWFFNCVPNDEQQAVAILKEIFIKGNSRKIVVFKDDSYDSEMAAKSFLKISEIKGYGKPVVINFSEFNKSDQKFITAVNSSSADCMILLTGPENSYKLIRLLNDSGIDIPVYGYFLTLNENILSVDEFNTLRNRIILPDAGWSRSRLISFENVYLKQYGTKPGPVAIFAYDATRTLIQAILNCSSSDYEKLRESLAQIKFEGLTGTVQFGDLGIRLHSCVFQKPGKN